MRFSFFNASFTGIFLLLGLVNICFAQQNHKPVSVKPGVSLELAEYRKSIISNIQYTLNFDIPAEKSKAINATENINLTFRQ